MRPIDVAVAVPPATVGQKESWLRWARIALRQERRAWDARQRGRQQVDSSPYVALEVEEAVQAVAAVRHCAHELWRVWRVDLDLAEETDVTPSYITTRPPVDGWEERKGRLLADGDEAVAEVAPRGAPGHPARPASVAAVSTAERASMAVNFLLDEVLTPALEEPTPALRLFADTHGADLTRLVTQRVTGSDLW